jgi:hypothetical protein
VFLGGLHAQQLVAPTPDQVGPPRGENNGDYNIANSFEFGYRFSQPFGDIGQYRSIVNYGNGLRLLGGGLSVNSKDGHGHYFDQIQLNTLGLGNDPYQSATLLVQKNRLYRYDMIWRLDDYYNPGLTIAGGTHLMDTSRRLQDHDLILLPQSKVRFHLGYSRNTENGPALSTSQEFNAAGSAFPVFTNVKRQWNEFRLGADGEFAGFKFTVLRRWDYYKDDTPFTSLGMATQGNPEAQTVLQQFQRSEPLHGRSPGWMGNLFTQRKRWGMNARINYVKGTGDFALDQFATGTGQFGVPAAQQIAVGGQAERPDILGDFTFNYFAGDRLTITENVSIHSQRMNGDSVYSEFFNGLGLGATLNFRYLGIRTLANSVDADYRVNKWLGFYVRYDYSDRLVKTIEGAGDATNPASFGQNGYNVDNVLQSGSAGVRVRPLSGLTFNLEGEVDRADHPLTPISPDRYHALRGRAAYRLRNLQVSASYRQVYNTNPQFGFLLASAHARTYNANASYQLSRWLTFDASYSKLHLDSMNFAVFFAGVNTPQLLTSNTIYISNIHAGTMGARFALGRRADLFVGYSITKDAGDGRATAVPPGVTDPVQALLDSVQTFPLTYQSPMARVSYRISEKIRWNVGWQFYNYAQMFQTFGYYQNFHANNGYTSVLWSF